MIVLIFNNNKTLINTDLVLFKKIGQYSVSEFKHLSHVYHIVKWFDILIV